MPDILKAVEFAAKAIRDGAHVVAGTVSEMRSAWADYEDGDWLSCAGADDLEQSLCDREAEEEVHEVREPHQVVCPNLDIHELARRLTFPPTPQDSAAPLTAADGPAGGDLAPLEAGDTPAGSPTPPSRDLPALDELLLDGANAIEMWLDGRRPPLHNSAWRLNAVYMRQFAGLYPPE